jgi:hypothetical protein
MSKGRKKNQQYTKYLKDPILEPYFIQLEEGCYTVHKNVISDNSREYSQKIGHYINFYTALSKVAEDITKSQSYDSIQDFINEYKKTINQLNQAYELRSTI